MALALPLVGALRRGVGVGRRIAQANPANHLGRGFVGWETAEHFPPATKAGLRPNRPSIRTPHRCCLINRFRLYGASLLAVAPKVTKRSCPIHPGLAALDSPHSIIAPWARCDGPSMAQHSSRGILPLNPLHNDYVRPAERGVVRAQMDGVGSKMCWLLIF
jgi:hypothetical protein